MIRNHLSDGRLLRLIGTIAVVVTATEAGANGLFFGGLAAGEGPAPVALTDLDGDSVPDLVTANYLSDDVSVSLGNGNGSFQAPAFFAADRLSASVAVADLDRDSIPDVVSANPFGDNNVSVLLGNGCLTGKTLDGTPSQGCDAIRTRTRAKGLRR